MAARKLMKLKDLDRYDVASKDPDVRGWNMVDKEGRTLGKIHELMVDPDAKKVRYLDVRLDNSITQREHEMHVLVPIGMASIHEKNDEVVAGFDKEKLLECPAIQSEAVEKEYEEQLLEKMIPEPGKIARNPEDFYQLEQFEPERFYGGRIDTKHQLGGD